MKLTSLTILGIGGIKNLKVNFDPEINIICGPNGVGKSTLLHAASLPFLHGPIKKIKRSMASKKGKVTLTGKDGRVNFKPTIDIDTYLPDENKNYFDTYNFDKKKLIKFETMRDFEYQKLNALSADSKLSESDILQQVNTGVNLYNIKEWFSKRILFENIKDGYGPSTQKNLHLAMGCISLLNTDYTFSRVDPKNYDIFVNTPTGEIWYEYLSSGFKSCMSLLLGIIKEVELRYPDELYAKEFEGVILIDEIELHLHPDWQSKILEALTTTFPLAQFIVTTHSPHVVQNAKPHQIIALVSDETGDVQVKEQPENGLGFSAWTVEEVLLDVMGMESTISRKLQDLLLKFNYYIDSFEFMKAKEIYDYLDIALHKNSVLRKSLKISLMSIRDRG